MKKQLTKEDFFYCYDKKLAYYLRHLKGIEYITKAKSIYNGFIFYLFLKTDELQKSIEEYKRINS